MALNLYMFHPQNLEFEYMLRAMRQLWRTEQKREKTEPNLPSPPAERIYQVNLQTGPVGAFPVTKPR